MARIQHGTLAATVVTTVTLDAQYDTATVICRATAAASTAEIYFRSDGTVPTVGGADCHVATFTVPMVVVTSAGDDENPLVVQLISGGNTAYTVMGS